MASPSQPAREPGNQPVSQFKRNNKQRNSKLNKSASQPDSHFVTYHPPALSIAMVCCLSLSVHMTLVLKWPSQPERPYQQT